MMHTSTIEKPRIVHRECGGWLALSPLGAALRIGVTAPSEGEAIEGYRAAVEKWEALLDASPASDAASSATGSVGASEA